MLLQKKDGGQRNSSVLCKKAGDDAFYALA